MRYASSLPPSADLVIVGGGVVGAATAFHASRAGLASLLIEARPRVCTLTTPASTGAFRLQFDNREELELVRESVDLFLHFDETTGQSTYRLDVRQQGYLWLTTSDEGVERQQRLVAEQHRWGQTDVEWLDGDEARSRFPYIDASVRGARFRQGDGFLDPKALTLGMLSASTARVLTGCTVIGFRIEGGRLTAVETSAGEVSTRAAVIAAGPFSGNLAALTGLRLPLQAVIRQKLIVPHVPLVPADAPLTIDEDTGAHWRPALQGAYLLFTDPATPAGPPLWDVPTSHDFAFGLLDPSSPVSVGRVVPFWRDVWQNSAAHWLLQAGQYSMTPDHRPLIGQTAIEGLYVNTGYSGHGVMGSPAGSRVLVDVITGLLSPEGNPLRPDRRFTPRARDVL